MKKLETSLPGVTLLAPTRHEDERGHFSELYNIQHMAEFFPDGIKQVSQSLSRKNVVRGLHFQFGPPMAKMIRVLKGSIWLVNVDVEPGSPSYGQHYSTILSEDNQRFCYAHAFIARGFCALEDDTVVEYFHDASHRPSTAVTIAWDDPELNIHWPVENPILSIKDQKGMSLREWRHFFLAMSMDM